MRTMRALLGLSALLGLLVPGLIAPLATAAGTDDLPPLADVPFYRADAIHSSIQPGPGPAFEPQLAWSHDLDSNPSSYPILVGGLLIIGTAKEEIVALDARTGEERWRASGRQPVSAAGLVIAWDASAVHAYDAASGIERWRRDVVGSESGNIQISDGIVYVGSSDGAVKGLDLLTGEDRWSWQGDHSLSVHLDAIADGVVYANPNDGHLLAIDLADGSTKWSFLGPVPVLNYFVADDTVFLHVPVNTESDQRFGQIAAIDAASGRVRWRFDRPSGREVRPGPFRDGVLYVSSMEDGMYALRDDGDSYAILWHAEAPEMHRPLTLVGNTLYGVNADGSLIAVRASDGALLWQTEPRTYATGPIISGGMAFTADLDGRTVWAFAEPDLIAQLPRPASAAQPTLQPVESLPDPFRVVLSTPLAETGVTLSPYERGRSEGPEGVNMTVGTDGLLYVIDPASVVTVIDPITLKVVRRFGRPGAGDGEFDCITYCTIDASPDGLLYVVDPGNHRIQVLEPDGTFARQVGSFGSAEGQFVQPFRMTIDGEGSAYVVDGESGAISKFDGDGAFVWRVGGSSGDPRLRGAYDVVAMKDAAIMVVLDPGGPAMLLDPDDGSVVGTWGDDSIGASGEPTIGPEGNVFLFQYVPGAMRMFDATGHPLGLLDYADDVPDPYHFYPTPVFTADGYGYSFDDMQGLLRLEIALP